MNPSAAPAARIELRLRELVQMFNSMDPSPFVTRDLDAAAETFIVGWARGFAGRPDFELVIHVTAAPPSERAAGVEEAVRHYFAERAGEKDREFHELLRRGRLSLLIGLVCLASTLTLGSVIARLQLGAVADVLSESLTIGGWVAMWRPMEIYLYDWWPIRREWRLYQRLSRMRVTLVAPEGAAKTG